MNFSERNKLIEALVSRGFTPGPLSSMGWVYIHKQDDFKLNFDSRGNFRLTTHVWPDDVGVATEAKHVLDVLESRAAAL